MSWIVYALISAVAVAATAILAELGVEGVPSTLATAIRTVVVTVFAWAMVFGLDQQRAIPTISRRTLLFPDLAPGGRRDADCDWRDSVATTPARAVRVGIAGTLRVAT